MLLQIKRQFVYFYLSFLSAKVYIMKKSPACDFPYYHHTTS